MIKKKDIRQRSLELAQRDVLDTPRDVLIAEIVAHTTRITDSIKWIKTSTRMPNVNERVIGYFPKGIEGSRSMDIVSTAITYDGITLHSDFPNSTSTYFIASHWMPLPYPPIEE